MTCRQCGRRIDIERPGRRDSCPGCDADLHACVQCEFYAPGQYNDCREPQAERVLDPVRSNFCDYFRPASGPGAKSPGTSAEDAKARFDALFKKK